MRNENQEQPHMRFESQWVWLAIVGEYEANTRRNDGADIRTHGIGQKEGRRAVSRGEFEITCP